MPINKDCWASRKRLVKLLGEVGAARMLELFGGVRIFAPVPGSAAFQRFSAKLGDEKIAQKLCTEFQGWRVGLPRRSVRLSDQIVKLHCEQLGPAEISRRLRCAERYVYLVLSRRRFSRSSGRALAASGGIPLYSIRTDRKQG